MWKGTMMAAAAMAFFTPSAAHPFCWFGVALVGYYPGEKGAKAKAQSEEEGRLPKEEGVRIKALERIYI
jgi:uncharacterized BrkB/YihY/UPF0761 family membrane protein